MHRANRFTNGRPKIEAYLHFWTTVCKTVRPMLLDRCPVLSVCLSVCPVCNVGALWPNDWVDQDETWQACRPQLWPHCVRRGPSSPPQKGAEPPPQFSAHVYCHQTAGWIKMKLGRQVGLGPGHIVLDGDLSPSPPKRHSPSGDPAPHSSLSPLFGPCLLRPNGRPSQQLLSSCLCY